MKIHAQSQGFLQLSFVCCVVFCFFTPFANLCVSIDYVKRYATEDAVHELEMRGEARLARRSYAGDATSGTATSSSAPTASFLGTYTYRTPAAPRHAGPGPAHGARLSAGPGLGVGGTGATRAVLAGETTNSASATSLSSMANGSALGAQTNGAITNGASAGHGASPATNGAVTNGATHGDPEQDDADDVSSLSSDESDDEERTKDMDL